MTHPFLSASHILGHSNMYSVALEVSFSWSSLWSTLQLSKEQWFSSFFAIHILHHDAILESKVEVWEKSVKFSLFCAVLSAFLKTCLHSNHSMYLVKDYNHFKLSKVYQWWKTTTIYVLGYFKIWKKKFWPLLVVMISPYIFKHFSATYASTGSLIEGKKGLCH